MQGAGCDATSDRPKSGRYVFFSEEFERIMAKYDQVTLSGRLNSVIMNHSILEADARVFYLYWTDTAQHLHPLKVTYSTSNVFPANYSAAVTEASLSQLVPAFHAVVLDENVKYGIFKVEEVSGHGSAVMGSRQSAEIKKLDYHSDNIPLLTMWLTLDGFIGELRTAHLASSLAATDVMMIFHYFSKLFQLEQLLVFDDSAIGNFDENVRVDLRLMSALATGRTWYEKNLKGSQLIGCSQFALTTDTIISQSEEHRAAALAALQGLPLAKWNEMLDVEGQAILAKLYLRYFLKRGSSIRFFRGSRTSEEKPVNFGSKTIFELAAVVYAEAEEKNELTSALKRMNDLLCGEGECKEPDDWIKSRIDQLLEGSCLWLFSGVADQVSKSNRQMIN